MAIFDQFLTEAREIQRKFRQERDAIKADKELSSEGKRRRLEVLEQRRQQEVAALQSNAHAIVSGRVVSLRREVRQAAEQRIEAERKLYGDALLAEMYRRDLEASDPQEIVRAYQAAVTDWERGVIHRFGSSILRLRLRAGLDQEAALNTRMALSALTEAAAELEPENYRQTTAELADAERALKRIEGGELDRETYNNEVATRMGVRADLIEE